MSRKLSNKEESHQLGEDNYGMFLKEVTWDFPGGEVVKNPPAKTQAEHSMT